MKNPTELLKIALIAIVAVFLAKVILNKVAPSLAAKV